MAAIDEIRKNRIKKLKAIQGAGFLAYPSKTRKTNKIIEALKNFNKLIKRSKRIILAGRVVSQRVHGKITFVDIKDENDRIQCLFKSDKLGEKGYQFFLNNFDVGDFIEVQGILFKTKKGEKTIEVSNYKMLAKSLLPLPEKWHGLKDIDERFRKRYLDLIFNKEVKEKFILRSRIIKEIREFLEKNEFFEVETPILESIYGGAKAMPFKTHLNSLNIDLYLRVSPELYLKRLLVGGLEKIYEIGRCFRNEGMDRDHNPDFTMLEFYWAYADYKDLMKFTEQLFRHLLKKIFNKTNIECGDKKIDFQYSYKRIEFLTLFKRYTKIDLEEINVKALSEKAKNWGIKTEKGADKAEIADAIYKKFCRPKIIEPTFIIHHPLGCFPLAKTLEKNPDKLANFQLVVNGIELINAFSELNNPIEQKKRFEEQEKSFKAGFKEAQRMDKDFIEAMEFGMPPSAGFGMGIDRLVALLTDSHSLREVILFPTMRPK
ncbi:MAG: lysine--tRNA ligase [Patescibacteria group bacterium]|nr:lysine--tRNA ligase [Patescibacteria group bacterium]